GQAPGSTKRARGRLDVSGTHFQHAEVVPGWHEAGVGLGRGVQLRACAAEVTRGHQLGAAVVAEVGEGTRVVDPPRTVAHGQNVALQVQGVQADAAADAGVDMAGAVDHARIPVPGQDLADFLHVRLHP